MQLVAYGAQDIYLTGNPQITFFKVVYRRHTNFSMETIDQTINGTVGDGTTTTVTISRNGDLVHKVYATSTNVATNCSELVQQVEVEIGGQLIDRHTSEWNQIWNELTTPESKAIGLKAMIGDIGTTGTASGAGTGVYQTQYPLNFWFCRNPGLALPLIALQYHEVKLKFTWGSTAQGAGSTGVAVVCDYIYLDTDERRRFAQVSHEYLIEQLQRDTFNGKNRNTLNFNHPVKELIWTSQPSAGYDTAHLKLNGHDRFSPQQSEYFRLRQPYDYHTAIPKQNLPSSAQLSTLDRNTQFVQLDRSNASDGFLSVELTELGAADDEGFYRASTTSITIGADATLPAEVQTSNNIVVGDQIAIVCTEQPGADEDKRGSLAGVYFATVTASPDYSVDKRLTLTISPPTTANDVPETMTGESSTTSGAGKFVVYLVRNGNSAQARTSQLTEAINVYSFGLKPEEHQPSGTCNFSRIDTAELNFTTKGDSKAPLSSHIVYAVNYNVLRIMSGMGGLAYSN